MLRGRRYFGGWSGAGRGYLLGFLGENFFIFGWEGVARSDVHHEPTMTRPAGTNVCDVPAPWKRRPCMQGDAMTEYLIVGGAFLAIVLAWWFLFRRVIRRRNLDNDCTRGGGGA